MYSSFLFLLLATSWVGQSTPTTMSFANETDESYEYEELLQEPGNCKCGVKGSGSGGNDYIYNGQEAEEHAHPWQVRLFVVLKVTTTDHGSFKSVSKQGKGCGGTLISSTHVLTAAHCVVDKGITVQASQIEVYLGEHSRGSGTQFNVKEVIKHDGYNPKKNRRHEGDPRGFDNDYAILRLSRAVDFTSEVTPACLPADVESKYEGQHATVTGWGRLGDGSGKTTTSLQEVEVTVKTNAECNKRAGAGSTPNMICAGGSGKDSCQGDSGGPLVAFENNRHTLIGVASFGKPCGGGYTDSGVYARVTGQWDWILANTKGTFSSTCEALN